LIRRNTSRWLVLAAGFVGRSHARNARRKDVSARTGARRGPPPEDGGREPPCRVRDWPSTSWKLVQGLQLLVRKVAAWPPWCGRADGDPGRRRSSRLAGSGREGRTLGASASFRSRRERRPRPPAGWGRRRNHVGGAGESVSSIDRRAPSLQRVLHHLHHDLSLTGERGDRNDAATARRAGPRRGASTPGQARSRRNVQKAVLSRADVAERGLRARAKTRCRPCPLKMFAERSGAARRAALCRVRDSASRPADVR